MNKCKGCDVYVPQKMGDNVAAYGLCQRNPPVIIMTPRVKVPVGRVSKLAPAMEDNMEIVPASYWPQVRETDGCGEHIPATSGVQADLQKH